MSSESIEQILANLTRQLQAVAPLAVAVSGGVDSMTLAVIALLMTAQEGTVRDVYRMSPEAMREAIDRMPSCAGRWVRMWASMSVVAPVSRLSPRAVRHAVVRCCGYRPSELLRASWR